jgi:hypothetical protein
MNGRSGRGVVWWLRNAPVSFEKFHQKFFLRPVHPEAVLLMVRRETELT